MLSDIRRHSLQIREGSRSPHSNGHALRHWHYRAALRHHVAVHTQMDMLSDPTPLAHNKACSDCRSPHSNGHALRPYVWVNNTFVQIVAVLTQMDMLSDCAAGTVRIRRIVAVLTQMDMLSDTGLNVQVYKWPNCRSPHSNGHALRLPMGIVELC